MIRRRRIVCVKHIVWNGSDVKDVRICKRCGRSMEWRKKWAKVWDTIQYCSEACRTKRLSAQDQQLEQSIVRLLCSRAAEATICPSEAAREVFPETWCDHMEAARMAARRLVASGVIEITQGGHIVDPSHAKGPIRLRKGKNFPQSC